MGFIKFLFVLVILIPIAIVMVFLISKLLDEVSGTADKSKRKKSSGNLQAEHNNESGYYPEYMYGNAQYDAYRQKRSKYIKSTEKNQTAENTVTGETGRNTYRNRAAADPLSRRKKRKERKHKKNSKQ